jgi:hypothetical protein
VTRGRREEVIPSAARLLGSLRDLGYDFVNAVADLIDNSITAGATRVDITIGSDGPDSWVMIVDNGQGMSAAQISEAMRLGSASRTYAGDDLGKFGLGLKTASLSQARAVTVASRSHPTRRQIDLRELDLDEIAATDRWEIVHPAAVDRPSQLAGTLQDGPGTVVLWTKLDRILNLHDPFGGWADRHLSNLAERLDLHLGMVFGRFLSGQARRHLPLSITINGSTIDPWDPFCLTESVEHLPEKSLQVGNSLVRYRPYVLPPQREFSDDDAWRHASGPNQWNRQQGLYIYRADRMIQSGGWSRLRAADEHVKLARAALEFWPELDDAFEINISKMRVKLPEELRELLKPLVSFLSGRADTRYRKSSRNNTPAPPVPARPPRKSSSPAFPADTGPGPTPGDVSGGGDPSDDLPVEGPTTDGAPAPAWGSLTDEPVPDRAPQNPPLPLGTATTGPLVPSGRRAALERAATRAGVLDALQQIGAELDRSDPEVARDLGW